MGVYVWYVDREKGVYEIVVGVCVCGHGGGEGMYERNS